MNKSDQWAEHTLVIDSIAQSVSARRALMSIDSVAKTIMLPQGVKYEFVSFRVNPADRGEAALDTLVRVRPQALPGEPRVHWYCKRPWRAELISALAYASRSPLEEEP
jgi:hypothetical protein